MRRQAKTSNEIIWPLEGRLPEHRLATSYCQLHDNWVLAGSTARNSISLTASTLPVRCKPRRPGPPMETHIHTSEETHTHTTTFAQMCQGDCISDVTSARTLVTHCHPAAPVFARAHLPEVLARLRAHVREELHRDAARGDARCATGAGGPRMGRTQQAAAVSSVGAGRRERDAAERAHTSEKGATLFAKRRVCVLQRRGSPRHAQARAAPRA